MCPNRTVVIEASSLLRLPPSQQLWQTARLCTGKSPETENVAPPVCSSTGEASEADLWLRPRQCVRLPHRKCQLSKGYPHTEKSLFPNLQVKCIFFFNFNWPPHPRQPLISLHSLPLHEESELVYSPPSLSSCFMRMGLPCRIRKLIFLKARLLNHCRTEEGLLSFVLL